MYRMIYSSTEVDPFGSEELKRLLIKSRIKNQEVSVTGMLIYDQGVFLQALEGEEASVNQIFSRIRADRRHENINLLFRNSAAVHRAFADWSMGFADASGASQILRGFLSIEGGLRAAVMDRSNAISILKSYATSAM